MSSEIGGSKLNNVLKAKEDLLKTPEQLESDKKEIIKSRLVKLDLDGLNKDDLIAQTEVYHEILQKTFEYIYALGEKIERQKYDMMELTKRAIQIEKGKSKSRSSNTVATGLGGSIFPFIAESYSNAGAKISLFSRYERVTDRRTLAQRRDLFENPPKSEAPPIERKEKKPARQQAEDAEEPADEE